MCIVHVHAYMYAWLWSISCSLGIKRTKNNTKWILTKKKDNRIRFYEFSVIFNGLTLNQLIANDWDFEGGDTFVFLLSSSNANWLTIIKILAPSVLSTTSWGQRPRKMSK